MNLFVLSWSYIKSKPLNTALNILLLSLGIAIISVLLILSKQTENALTKNSQGIDLVVGAKGSPMQIILSGVFQVDYPTGNIPLKEAKVLARNRFIKKIIPMAMGDSYHGLRIVGTNYDYLALYHATISRGKLWEKKMETVLGYDAAQKLEVTLGDTLFSAHGLVDHAVQVHDNQGYIVVGILEKTNTVVDHLIISSVESVWAVHDHADTPADNMPAQNTESHHHEAEEGNTVQTSGLPHGDDSAELTTMLLQYRSPMAAVQLPRYINQNTGMQAASPAFEVTRLFSLIGVGVELIQGLAIIIIFIAALSIFIALYNALQERKYDLAVMRSLGASKIKLFTHVILEGLIITTSGSVLGILLAQVAIILLDTLLVQSDQLGMTSQTFFADQFYLIGGSMMVGILASVLPAIGAYRTNISDTLSQK